MNNNDINDVFKGDTLFEKKQSSKICVVFFVPDYLLKQFGKMKLL